MTLGLKYSPALEEEKEEKKHQRWHHLWKGLTIGSLEGGNVLKDIQMGSVYQLPQMVKEIGWYQH